MDIFEIKLLGNAKVSDFSTIVSYLNYIFKKLLFFSTSAIRYTWLLILLCNNTTCSALVLLIEYRIVHWFFSVFPIMICSQNYDIFPDNDIFTEMTLGARRVWLYLEVYVALLWICISFYGSWFDIVICSLYNFKNTSI